jgi:hypothetical protein
MACNVNNYGIFLLHVATHDTLSNYATAVSKYVSVKSGDKLTFEWYHDSRNDDIIASSHYGPIQVCS